VRAADAPGLEAALESHDALLLGASIRYGHHARSLERWVREHRAQIERRPNAFFSVCLSAGGPGEKRSVAEGYVADFLRRTGWQPRASAIFAGALRYSQYRPWTRWLVRLVMGVAGGETDASRDHEYTDWDAVDRFARELARQWSAGTSATA
jgi:menaquinone-dependent protoporphyrinogen oxidase